MKHFSSSPQHQGYFREPGRASYILGERTNSESLLRGGSLGSPVQPNREQAAGKKLRRKKKEALRNLEKIVKGDCIAVYKKNGGFFSDA